MSHSAENDVAVEEVRQVLNTYWTMVLEGQAPSADWLYRKVRACIPPEVIGDPEVVGEATVRFIDEHPLGGTSDIPPALPLHRTEATYGFTCSTCDGGGCLDCTDPA